MAMIPATKSSCRFSIGGNRLRKRVPKFERRMRSGSAAMARNGKIDVMPMTWNSACASESEKMATSFALPYGRARNTTRRIRSATLWINRDKAVPSYTFKNNGTLHLGNGGTPNYLWERL